ncbi:MAG: porphobilinogen synthase [Candidatus Omnitrophota bacterium]|nr:porphobilinogen synthase [Candidatus Omnitrophota bacterium]
MPNQRLSRLRNNPGLRDLVSETNLHPKDFILPYFVVGGRGKREPIASMPGIYRFSTENLLKDIEETKGIRTVLLFGLPESKDETGSQAYRKDGVVQKAVAAIKKEFADLTVVTDVCLCGYTGYGHCGIQRVTLNPSLHLRVNSVKGLSLKIDSERTLEALAKIALSHAEAGADLVAPSAMMDGQVAAIREALNRNGFGGVGILAYSAKYASNFYGPFRDALDSAPAFGDRKTYQMDFRNAREALREVEQDILEGADIVMVKPALAYLDIIYRVKEKFNVPVAAYSVSGEYAMLKKATNENGVSEKDLVLEVLTAIKRAGADFIITYYARDVLRWL